MAHSSPDQPHEGNPAAVEILRVFWNTTVAGIEGLTLLLGECADLRADLVTVHSLHSDGDGMFSARQQDRILVLQKAAMAMQTLLDALPREVVDGTMNAGNVQWDLRGGPRSGLCEGVGCGQWRGHDRHLLKNHIYRYELFAVEMHFRESREFEITNVERLKRSSEAVARARELVSEAKRQIEESMELVEELQTNKSRTELLCTTYKTRSDARKASLEWAKALKNEVRRLRNRFTRLKRATPWATDGHRLKRQLTAGAEAVSALKQTLSDLESVRMTLPNDPTLQKLKTDIRKVIARSEVSTTKPSREREDFPERTMPQGQWQILDSGKP